MDASVFVRLPNSTEYSNLGLKEFSVLPRVDEFISAEVQGGNKFFQVFAVHHSIEKESIEIYAIQTEPNWEVRKKKAIGFGS
ncbi:MAG: hypothetical protein WD824_05555 [Cyclobacteriaceae bacterium]